MNQPRGRGWGILERAGLLLGIFTAIVAIAQAIKPIRRATSEIAAFIWPGGVVGVLSVAAVVLLIAHVRRRRQLDAIEARFRQVVAERDDSVARARDLEESAAPARRDHDRRIIEHLVEVMPRQAVRFLAEQDFGASWRRSHVLPVHVVANEFNDPEHRLLDAELEALRCALVAAAQEFSVALGQDSAPMDGAAFELSEPIPSLDMDLPPPGAAGDRWRATQKRLNDASAQVAGAYDRLLGAAHERLQL